MECVERGLDPLTTNLVVADESRTDKTICLAVSPALKAHGISGRARLFEVVQRVDQVNAQRRRQAPGGVLTGRATDAVTGAPAPDYWRWTTSSPRPGWRITWSSAPGSIRSI